MISLTEKVINLLIAEGATSGDLDDVANDLMCYSAIIRSHVPLVECPPILQHRIQSRLHQAEAALAVGATPPVVAEQAASEC